MRDPAWFYNSRTDRYVVLCRYHGYRMLVKSHKNARVLYDGHLRLFHTCDRVLDVYGNEVNVVDRATAMAS